MEPPLEKLVSDAIAHGLWSYSWIFAIVSAVVAAAGAMMGAYLKKTGELHAIEDRFKVSLEQLRTQTQETESIKTGLASQLESIKTSLASQLDEQKDIRERDRSFGSFQRSDIATHRDAIIELAKILVPIFRVSGHTTWVDQVDLKHVQDQVGAAISGSAIHLSILSGYNSIDDGLRSIITDTLRLLSNQWDQLNNHLMANYPKFCERFPDTLPFDNKKYFDEWLKLQSLTEEFVKIIGELPNAVRFPR